MLSLNQNSVVITTLMKEKKMSREQAMKEWFTSKTFRFFNTDEWDFVSGARCYDELIMEKEKNELWLRLNF